MELYTQAPPVSTSHMMANVLARKFCRLQGGSSPPMPPQHIPQVVLDHPVSTPLQVDAWEQALARHPDREWVQALLSGIRHGFRIGLQSTAQCRSTTKNAPSALTQGQVVDQFIAKQIAQGYMLGPFTQEESPGVTTSKLAVIPKKTPGQWRVIVDLSSPAQHSVNDNLRRDLTHVAYSSVEDAVLLVHFLGRSALLAKVDLKDAYRMVPVHPRDRSYLGVCWREQVYVDTQLPFGLASAPAIFSALAEALEWILRSRGVTNIVHYLDDYLIGGAPSSGECAEALQVTLRICEELGVPLSPDKVEGPTTSLVFLGIVLDSTRLQVSLPPDKLSRLRAMLQEFVQAKVVRDYRAFDSLVGHLVHATKVLPLGKAFLNQLFALKRTMDPGSNPIRRLNLAARADVAWWLLQCQDWSGSSASQFLLLEQPSHHLYTDASGSWGCGAWSLPHWLQVPWQDELQGASIALKELVPVVVAAALWGAEWSGSYVMCHSDNSAVVAQVNRLHARDPLAAHLLRCLAYFQAQAEFRIRAIHLPGHLNAGADDLSRNRAAAFQARFPSASPTATQVPQGLMNLLLHGPLEWVSQNWRSRFSASWRPV